jgi:DNA polymerase type B, organellar and viral
MQGYPRRYIVLDTETTAQWIKATLPTQRLTLRLGICLIVDPDTYGDREDIYHGFNDADEFWAMIRTLPQSKDPVYVLAHNMGFDSRIIKLYDKIADGTMALLPPAGTAGESRYKTPLFIAESPPFIVRVFRDDGQRFVWLDTFQWLRASLAKVGEWIKYPKKMMPDADAPDSVWMDYCQGDVDTLHQALKRLWGYLRAHNIPDWEYTPAALSRRIYTIRFEKKRIEYPEDPSVLKLDRLGYYAGKVECFRVGPVKGPIYQIDVCSLYPHMMAQNPFPAKVVGHGDWTKESEIPGDFRPDSTTGEVWIRSGDSEYPVRGSDQTLYTNGAVRTVLCGPELHRAWTRGHVVRVGRWVRFECRDLFSSYMSYWTKSRQASDRRVNKLESSTCKMIANSLHGKFGQQTGEWEHVGKDSVKGTFASGRIYSPEVRKWIDLRVLDGHHYERHKADEDARSFVPIASWTASYGRVYMDWMIDIAGPDDVLYQATDSLLVTSAGYHRLKQAGVIDTGQVGHFRTEATYNEVTIWNVNQLDLDTSKRRSGVRTGSVEIEPGIWSCERWESCADGVFSTNQDSVTIETTLIAPSLRFSRREVTANGMTVPWSIDNWTYSPERQALVPVLRRSADRK